MFSGPYTSTRSGSPLTGSAHTSTWSRVVAGSCGVSRTPAASIPAIRRAGSEVSSSLRDPWSRVRPKVGGSRSEASGNLIFETGVTVAVSDSKTQRIETVPLRNRLVSPVLRIRSTRQWSGPLHQTRSRLVSPSSRARLAKESLSGTCSVPEVSANPDHGTAADRSIRSARSSAAMLIGCAGRASTASGVPTSTAAASSTTSQRALMRATVGGHPTVRLVLSTGLHTR